MRLPGFEPGSTAFSARVFATPGWKAVVLPLDYRRFLRKRRIPKLFRVSDYRPTVVIEGSTILKSAASHFLGMDSSNRLAGVLFAAFVLTIFAFFLAPGITTGLSAEHALPVPATGFLVLVAVWLFPVIAIAAVVAYLAYRAIRK